ncbi:type I-C CRISPR-associated protein Cas8c/Csd1 [Sporolituus thermophilus]|uniref:CRISPR-associated protein Csd1 n=1 Tax=Sporolituus thermophilus DSM 23256 TaxID=1123285 RepID=A0A1G7PF03_9FIRM|nr:type I-C CRISPR-associated protein Cas8c/Csd1 [Sporolituus thermophilus]SDF84060.1 CRISPR-associated protein Csd1 [Sporolituus thermophilus DSM 23256]
MLLQKLLEFETVQQKIPAGYVLKSIDWVIEIDQDGNLLNLISLKNSGKKDKGKSHPLPDILRSGTTIRPALLADTADYVLGGETGERGAQKHEEFVKLVRECAQATGMGQVQAVAAFYEKKAGGCFDDIFANANIDLKDRLVFRMAPDVCYVTDWPMVQQWWAARLGSGRTAGNFTCIVCGQPCQPVDRHPIQIKSIPGGQSSGMAIVSANSNAFESYGLTNSLIAPTCRECAELYAKGLNRLLDSEQHNIKIIVYKKNGEKKVDGLAAIFWSKSGKGFPLTGFLTAPNEDEVHKLLTGVWTGQDSTFLDAEQYYFAFLAANNARVVVKDWLNATLKDVKERLCAWFAAQKIVGSQNGTDTYYGIFPLAAALYRDVNEELRPEVVTTLLRAALFGQQLPPSLLAMAVRRAQVMRSVTRPLAVLIKIYLLQKGVGNTMEHNLSRLAQAGPPAYLCGRLLAVLERLQQAAQGDINATITDRYFGAASTRPATVFPVLLQLSRAHLAKLRRDRATVGLATWFDRELGDILSQMPASGFPLILSLQEQGLFALGYYHQKNDGKPSAQVGGDNND